MDNLTENPKIANWMRPEKKEFRLSARGYLDRAFELDMFPDNKPIDVNVFRDGESSVVFKIDTSSSGPFVVKMNPAKGLLEGEAAFFNEWAKQGVKVPDIIMVRSADDIIPATIMVMEYVDFPTLTRTISTKEMIESGKSRELGMVLATMHRAKGTGFGDPRMDEPLVGVNLTFSENMETVLFGDRIAWLLGSEVIDNKEVRAARRAVEIIEEDLDSGVKPSLIHGDFRPYNIFATDPITIFDPKPNISHPHMCLALTLLKPLVNKPPGFKEREEILLGYKEIAGVNERVLAAATVLRGIAKLYTWHRKNRMRKVRLLKEVVDENSKIIS